MSDVHETDEAPRQAPKIVTVPVTKGKTGMKVDINAIPEHMWDEVVLAGLKVVLNGGMTKVTAKDIPNEDERKAKAVEIAEDRLQQLYDGTLRIGRGSTTTKQVSGEEKIEARQIARKNVKAQLKKKGFMLKDFDPKDINQAADDLLEGPQGEEIYAEAKAAIDKRNKKDFDLGNLKPSATAKAKAARKSQERKADVSAAQAGRAQPYRPSPRA